MNAKSTLVEPNILYNDSKKLTCAEDKQSAGRFSVVLLVMGSALA